MCKCLWSECCCSEMARPILMDFFGIFGNKSTKVLLYSYPYCIKNTHTNNRHSFKQLYSNINLSAHLLCIFYFTVIIYVLFVLETLKNKNKYIHRISFYISISNNMVFMSVVKNVSKIQSNQNA